LHGEVAGWQLAPVHLSIFGSAARGDGNTASDIDMFVIRPRDVSDDDQRWREQLARLSDHVFAWTGNHAGLSEVSETEMRRLRCERPPVVTN
jgi:predicted nucleotidyltransferase